jgi:hypothetical protein
LHLAALILAGSLLALNAAPALAQDAQICLATADRVTKGEPVEDEAKYAAHEACLRAFDIMGTRPKQ